MLYVITVIVSSGVSVDVGDVVGILVGLGEAVVVGVVVGVGVGVVVEVGVDIEISFGPHATRIHASVRINVIFFIIIVSVIDHNRWRDMPFWDSPTSAK
jgi:hypothetical protein